MSGRVALVTGGAGPTGAAIARRLAEEGAAVMVSSRGGGRIDDVVGSIRAEGGRCVPWVGEISDRRGAADVVSAALRAFGSLDVVVNNAGGMAGAPFTELSEAQLDAALGANLRSAFWVSQAAVAVMRERGRGRIVNLSSLSARGSVNNADYAAAKAAVEGLTRSLALEIGPDGITVNAVSPGLIEHPGTRGRWGASRDGFLRNASMGLPVEPVDIANAVLFLASDEARRITGQVLTVSAGLESPPTASA